MTQLRIDQIRLDGGTQPRAQLDFVTIGEYAEAMKAGAQFPNVDVFYDGTYYWLADGFHRIEAARKIAQLNLDGHATVEADVRQGDRRAAILFACGANSSHGLRRTNADKRRSVVTMLRDEEWTQWSDREIARRCAVSNAFVGNLRAEIAPQERDDADESVAPDTSATPAEITPAEIAPVVPDPSRRDEIEQTAPVETKTRPAASTAKGMDMAAARKAERSASRERTVKRGGKTIKMRTAKIGKGKKSAKKTPAGTASKAANKAQIAGRPIKIERVVVAPVAASARCAACDVEPLSYDRKNDAWHCGNCGALVILSVSLANESACPQCAKPIIKGAAFCGYCGKVM